MDILAYGVVAIFVVMLLKEVGVPIPIPSDLIMITAGVQAATGHLSPVALLLAVAAATLVGSSIQFLVIRAVGRRAIDRFGPLIGLTPERLAQAAQRLQTRGSLAIILGLNVPGARAGIIPAASLAGLSYAAFAPAMFGGSFVFYLWHMALGYVVGPSAVTLLSTMHAPLALLVLVLAALGLIGWLVISRQRHQHGSVRAWSEAACPACLALAALDREMVPLKTDQVGQ